MIKKIKLIVILVVLINVKGFAQESHKIKEIPGEMQYFRNYALRKVSLYEENDHIKSDFEIYALDKSHYIKSTRSLFEPPKPALGKLIWRISGSSLPVTEDMCDKYDIETCNDLVPKKYCYSSCVLYGPSLGVFDQKANKIYFYAPSNEVGQVGAYFTFVADIATKSIKPLQVISGPFSMELSPSGKYVITVTGTMAIIDTTTAETIRLGHVNDWSSKPQKLHYMQIVKWLNDYQFVYTDGIRQSKFQDSYNEMTEGTFDILAKKIISERKMAKSEFDSREYHESN